MAVKDTSEMIAGMTPALKPGVWVYCTTQDNAALAAVAPDALALFREEEGATMILPANVAKAHGYDASLGLRQITLSVFSDLEGVGLTAAVATALSEVNIPCNVVAAYYHDHVFVPQVNADQALETLSELQRSAQAE